MNQNGQAAAGHPPSLRHGVAGRPALQDAGAQFGRAISLLLTGALIAAITGLLTGCKTPGVVAVDLSRPYHPDNVYLAASKLPAKMKRVAVMPLACDAQQTDLAAGGEALGPILTAVLIGSKKFEVVQVSRGELRRLTGRAEWTGNEELPAGFLGSLKREYGCDAVMFCELTEYRAYPPLEIGWRLRLVEVGGKKTIWVGDEQFDAGKPGVIAAALHYHEMQQRQYGDDTTDWLTVNSPRWFGEYSLDSLFKTLPDR